MARFYFIQAPQSVVILDSGNRGLPTHCTRYQVFSSPGLRYLPICIKTIPGHVLECVHLVCDFFKLLLPAAWMLLPTL